MVFLSWSLIYLTPALGNSATLRGTAKHSSFSNAVQGLVPLPFSDQQTYRPSRAKGQSDMPFGITSATGDNPALPCITAAGKAWLPQV